MDEGIATTAVVGSRRDVPFRVGPGAANDSTRGAGFQAAAHITSSQRVDQLRVDTYT
jgi:hypothetical protein